jgi:hypothetical protein
MACATCFKDFQILWKLRELSTQSNNGLGPTCSLT